MNWYSSLGGWCFSILVAITGYFSPVKNVIHVMCAVIIFDLIFGLWAAKVQGKGWCEIKMWRTIHKLLIAIVLILLLYAIDKEIGSTFIKLHLVIAWLISGFEIWSILKSASKISGLRIFQVLGEFMEDKINSQTGVNIKDDENN
jgi:phage-related holin